MSYHPTIFEIGFYEHINNFEKPLELYKHNKHKMVRGYDNSQFISWKIDDKGVAVKNRVSLNSVEFLFPWMKNSEHSSQIFFKSTDFLPVGFLFKSQ